MSKIIHFTSGLPRACSTLLQNLLAQNPTCHATATSGLHEIMYLAKAFFKTDEFRATPAPLDGEQLFEDFIYNGIINSFNSLTDRPVVIDKCRSWIGSIGLVLKINPNAKFLVPVRDIRGVISSMEKKFQAHPSFQLEGSQQDTSKIQTVEGRCQFWLNSAPIGIAIQRIYEVARLHKDQVHFIHAEDLTTNPQKTMNKVWEYLGMDSFTHNTSNIKQYTKEHELGWPYGDHIVKPEITPLVPDWHDTLGSEISNQLDQKFNWINKL
jgi:sulfotransferase